MGGRELEIVKGVFIYPWAEDEIEAKRYLEQVPAGITRSVYDIVRNVFVGVANPPAALVVPCDTGLRFESDEVLRMIDGEFLSTRVVALRTLRHARDDTPVDYLLHVDIPSVGRLRLHVHSRPFQRQPDGKVRLTVSDVCWELLDD